MRLRMAIGRPGGVVLLAGALVILPGLAVDARAAGSDDGASRPADLIRASVARVQQVVRSTPGRGSETERAEIREIAETMFDFEAMAQRILARHWNEGTPEQQREFVRLFTNLLARTYIDVIVRAVSVSATVDGESIEGPYARVRTRMGGDVGPAVSIDYRLFQHGKRWAVYDVVHEGVSLVANYRSQFGSVLGTSSFAGVLERMRINESQARGRPETAAALGKRLLLFSVVAERGAR